MPTYEYQCAACGHQLEAFQKITEEPLTDCPSCQKSALTKLISATNFQLKGTGWYVTDIRDKGKPKPAETEAAPAAKTESTDTKSDSTSSNTKAGE